MPDEWQGNRPLAAIYDEISSVVVTSTEPTSDRERFSRVYYGPRARTAHLLSSRSVMNFAVCGVYSGTGSGWLGTGSQEERDHAASLPLCEDCARISSPSISGTPRGYTASLMD